MSVRINTNIEALNAQRNLTATAATFAKSVEKLSSGLRINRAADDAAGLAISEKLKAQVTGLNQAQRNAQDGISMVQTAEGALNEVHSMLQRIRELAVEASNSTLQGADLTSVGTEVSALQSEIDRIGNSTSFNGAKLLNGSLGVTQAAASTASAGMVVAAGTNTSIQSVNVSGAKASAVYTLTSTATGVTLTSSLAGTPSQSIVDANIAVSAQGTTVLNFDTLGVTITLASVAGETAANVKAGLATKHVDTSAGAQAQFQVGANNGESIGVTFTDNRVSAQLNAAIAAFTGGATVTTAGALISSVDTEIASVSTQRGNLGAVQNRLEHTTASISVASENLNASMSRIRDLDVASEMVAFTKTQILQQAGTAILAQANSAPQNILTLLR